MCTNEYNARLFSNGIRKKIHEIRFHWLAQQFRKLNLSPQSILELGCFDAKTLSYLPNKPTRYVGLDANWEGGLNLAKEQWQMQNKYLFLHCEKPEDIILNEYFEISICMETLEHVQPEMVLGYLQKLAHLTNRYIFITVPNEKGIVFALKYLIKKIFFLKTAEKYTFKEFIYALLGQMSKIKRAEHKGFDYQHLIQQISQFFVIRSVMPLPFIKFMPNALGFGIGIIAEKIQNQI